MDNQNNNNQEEFLTIRDLWEIFINNVWLFVVSVAACVAVAVAYLVTTPPVYERSTSVLIKDEKSGNSSITSQTMEGFEDLGLFNANLNVNNELKVIQTIPNIEEVVRRLGLQYNYAYHYNGFRWLDMYDKTPFKLKLEDDFAANISFKLKFKNDNELVISELQVGQDKYKKDISAKLNENITTTYGKLKIVTTPLFDAQKSIKEEYKVSYTPINQVAKAYKSNLVATVSEKGTSIIDMSVKDKNPVRAEHFLNTLVSVYNENWILDKNEVTISTSHFIDDRISVIQRELEVVENNISDFKRDALMPDYAAVTGISLEQANKIRETILQLNNQLSMAKYVQTYLKENTSADQILPAAGINNDAIEVLITKYNELMLQKNVLLSSSSAQNPVVAELIENINSMRGVIDSSIDDYINSLEIQIKIAEEENKSSKAYLAKNPEQAKDLLSIERQQEVKVNLYLYLLQKREENELSQTFSAYNTKVLNPAHGSLVPVSPRSMIILLFGVVIGCALPVAYILLKVSLETTVQNNEDLSKSSIPYLGAIPLICKKKRWFDISPKVDENEKNIVINDTRDGANEMFRVVRTNLDFMLATTDGCKTTMMTSFNPKSGKSFFSFNLALSMTKKADKVLVIDGDLRRGTLSSMVDSPKKGLVNYLNNQIDNIDEIIVKGAYDTNIRVLPMGIVPPNPTELLLSDRFTKLMEQLKAEYNYIFIDCPPLDFVPDANIMEKFCDASIFIVRAGLFDKRLLPNLEALYVSKKLKNMSIVLNAVNYKKTSKYSYANYGYAGYGSYAGYGN